MNRSVPTLCAIAVALCGLAACNQAPAKAGASVQAQAAAPSAGLQEPPVPETGRTDPEAVAMRDAYVKWVVEKAHPAGLPRPEFPDPRRTDPAAKVLYAKYALWRVAEDELASAAALKLMNQQLGLNKPAPKGAYGHMAEGLSARSAG